MTRKWRTSLFLTLAVVLTVCATGFEIEVIGAGMTIGDMTGTPPAQTPAGQQTIRDLQHRGNLALTETVSALVGACFFLGAVLGPSFERRTPGRQSRLTGYFVSLVACPVVSVLLLILIARIGAALSPN